MNTIIAIRCLECKQSIDFDRYRLSEEAEGGATLICPNCGSEFSLTATLEKLPGGEEPGGDEFDSPPGIPPELPSREGPGPRTSFGSEPSMGGPGELDDLAASKRSPVIPVQVLSCTDCSREWVGSYVGECVHCSSKNVLASTKSVKQRCLEAAVEVERGVPVDRALDKLLGRGAK